MPLPLRHRLRAATTCTRLKRLLYTPALRAATRPDHQMLSGGFLRPGGALTSPDGRFRFILQHDTDLALLYYAPHRNVDTARGTPVWTMQTVRGGYGYVAWRLSLTDDGLLAMHDLYRIPRWTSRGANVPPPAGYVGPYRLVVRNEGDAAIMDAEDTVVWMAVPERRPWLDAA